VKNVSNTVTSREELKESRYLTADNEIARDVVKDLMKTKVADFYYERDQEKWFASVRQPNFVQDRCRPEGL